MKRNRCGGGVRVESGSESLVRRRARRCCCRPLLVSGLAEGLSRALRPWRAARSVHDPGKTVLDLAVTIALGGDCLADAAVVRAQPELFGAVASDPTISRLIDALGDDPARRSRRSAGLVRRRGPRCGATAHRSRRRSGGG